MRYFVMLNGGNGLPLPMVHEDDGVALFDSRSDAVFQAENNILGQARGYEVFKWDFYEGDD